MSVAVVTRTTPFGPVTVEYEACVPRRLHPIGVHENRKSVIGGVPRKPRYVLWNYANRSQFGRTEFAERDEAERVAMNLNRMRCFQTSPIYMAWRFD